MRWMVQQWVLIMMISPESRRNDLIMYSAHCWTEFVEIVMHENGLVEYRVSTSCIVCKSIHQYIPPINSNPLMTPHAVPSLLTPIASIHGEHAGGTGCEMMLASRADDVDRDGCVAGIVTE
jgi:hypothetical protein